MLVVDDLAASRESLITKLSLFEFQSLAVPSVAMALERACDAGGPFDLVLADELMPGAGGEELLKTLRADPATQRLPFILMSLFGADRDHAA